MLLAQVKAAKMVNRFVKTTKPLPLDNIVVKQIINHCVIANQEEGKQTGTGVGNPHSDIVMELNANIQKFGDIVKFIPQLQSDFHVGVMVPRREDALQGKKVTLKGREANCLRCRGAVQEICGSEVS